MEQILKIKTQDKKNIYAKLNFKSSENDKLIIFVHGLTGEMNEHIFFNAAKFFPQNGFSVLRINLYSSEPDARRMEECSILTHTDDLDRVIDSFRDEYRKLYIVGHSLAGLAILNSKKLQYVAKIVLWDPTLNFDWAKKRYKFNKELGVYFKESSWYKPLGKNMYNEFQKIVALDCYKNIKVKTKIIVAGENRYIKELDSLKAIINENVEVFELKNAGHNFDEEGVEDKLFKSTLEFLV